MPEVFDDNLTLYMAALGWIIPMIISLVKQSGWSKQAKGLVAALVSVASAMIAAAIAGHWNPEDVTRSVLIVLTLSQVSYVTFWKSSGIDDSIERSTSVQK